MKLIRVHALIHILGTIATNTKAPAVMITKPRPQQPALLLAAPAAAQLHPAHIGPIPVVLRDVVVGPHAVDREPPRVDVLGALLVPVRLLRAPPEPLHDPHGPQPQRQPEPRERRGEERPRWPRLHPDVAR